MIGKVNDQAKRRIDVLVPGTASKDAAGNEHLPASAPIALQQQLAKAGMSLGQAAYFTDLLWRCGPELKYQPRLDKMAADWGISRQVLSGKIAAWKEQGLCSCERQGRHYAFRFPRFDALIQAVQEMPRPRRTGAAGSCQLEPEGASRPSE